MTTLEIRKNAYQIIEKLITWKKNEIGYLEAGEDMEDFYNEAVEEVSKIQKRIQGIRKWIEDNHQIPEFKHWFASRRVSDWMERAIVDEITEELGIYK